MKKNSFSYLPVMESMPTSLMPMYGGQAQTGQLPTSITDVITIGDEATVFRPVQRSLRPTGWAVTHASSLQDAITYLRSNAAAVAIAEVGLAGADSSALVSALHNTAAAPEVVLLTWDDLPLHDALRAGAFDVVKRPIKHPDLLWAVAAAWHKWMTRRERASTGGPRSNA